MIASQTQMKINREEFLGDKNKRTMPAVKMISTERQIIRRNTIYRKDFNFFIHLKNN